jgi:hypothetical protein
MPNLLDQIRTAIVLYLPNVLLALLILIVGWLVATALAALTRNLLHRTQLDDRIGRSLSGDPSAPAQQIQTEMWISRIVFWIVILFTLVAFFQTLNIPAVSGPLGGFLDQIVAYIPGVIGALVLLAIAWLIATVLRAIIVRLLDASGFERRLSEGADVETPGRMSLSQTIGNVVYWLIFLLFLPAILDALNLTGLLGPVQTMVNDILAFLPNLLGAFLILIIGWLVARIIRQIVTNLLAGLGVDRFGARAGLPTDSRLSISQIIGTVVYVLILVPVAIAALNALNIPAVSEPAAAMLTNLLNALPAIFGAILLLVIAVFVARLVGTFVAGILANLGFDRLFRWMGLFVEPRRGTPPPPSVQPEQVDLDRSARAAAEGAGPGDVTLRTMSPSAIAGYLVTIAIILFAAMEAANMLGFETLTVLISQFIVAAGRVLVGLLIFGLGLYFAYLAERFIREAGVTQSHILAPAARIAIIIFAAALALRQMGIAESIVNLAFGLMLGAVAVAIALAFGLGGREIAARQLEQWRQDVRSIPPDRGPNLPNTGGMRSSDEPRAGWEDDLGGDISPTAPDITLE